MLLCAAAGVAGYGPAWLALFALGLVQIGLVLTTRQRDDGAELRLRIVLEDDRRGADLV
jgi:hypothetical protein